MNIDFEPFKPINTSLYLCDNKFHTEVGLFLLSLFDLLHKFLIVIYVVALLVLEAIFMGADN